MTDEGNDNKAFRRGYGIGMSMMLLLLLIDVLGWRGLLHPRKCPACRTPYHRGQKCDWSETADGQP